MGAAPRYALLSLVLPPALPLARVDGLLDGFLDIAGTTGVTLAGGNITRSPGPLVVDVTVIGSVRPRRILTRSGGRPGDGLYVTGTIGAAAAGLGWLREHGAIGSESPDSGELAECVARHRRPEPRARVGALLGRNRAATACMDLSDGLADAIRQLAESSGVGARVAATALPIHPGAAALVQGPRRGCGSSKPVRGRRLRALVCTLRPRARPAAAGRAAGPGAAADQNRRAHQRNGARRRTQRRQRTVAGRIRPLLTASDGWFLPDPVVARAAPPHS